MYVRTSLIFMVFLIGIDHVFMAMTEKQLKAAGKLIRNACQPKTKVTDALIEEMHKGVWNEDNTAKCYMFCVLVNTKVLTKTGEPDWDVAYKSIQDLPTKRQDLIRASMDKCREEVEITDDNCDTSWRMSRCIYMDNPDNYFLP